MRCIAIFGQRERDMSALRGPAATECGAVQVRSIGWDRSDRRLSCADPRRDILIQKTGSLEVF